MKLLPGVVLLAIVAVATGCAGSASAFGNPPTPVLVDPTGQMDYSGMEDEFADLLTRPTAAQRVRAHSVEIAGATPPTREELRGLLLALREAQSTGNVPFDAITRIDFESPTTVHAYFIWSGGFHGGRYTIEMSATTWEVTDRLYSM